MPRKRQRQFKSEAPTRALDELVNGELRARRKKSVVVDNDSAARRHTSVKKFEGILDWFVKIEIDVCKRDL